MYNIILTNLNLILTRTKDHHLPKDPDPFGVLSAVLLEDPYFWAARSVFWLTCLDSLGRSASQGLFTTLEKEITPSAHRYCQNVTKREESKKGCCDSVLFVLRKESDSVLCLWVLAVPVWMCCLKELDLFSLETKVTGRGHHQFI